MPLREVNNFDMRYSLLIGIALCGFFSTYVTAQTETKQESTTSIIEHVRAESGVDPITIRSKIVFTSFINDPKGPSGRITNSLNLTLGIKRWSMGLGGSFVSLMTGNPGEGFHSGVGDFVLSLQNKIYAHGKQAMAVAGVLTFPTGQSGYGSQYFSFTPVLTYLYAFKPSVIFVLQPQYSMHIMKDPLSPNLRLLTIRALAAQFTKTGFVFGLEMKPIINIEADIFYLYVSPFFGKSLGAGFNLLFLCDIPVNKPAIGKGLVFQLGINRNI